MKHKKKDFKFIYIGLIILGFIIFIWGGSQGWFKSSVTYIKITNTTIIERLKEVPVLTPLCTLSFNPLAVFTGDEVTGIIQNGKNTLCNVYATDGTDWYLIYTGTTDNNGRLARTENIYLEGTFRFRSICGDCTTNEVTLYVNPLPEEEPAENCTDTDGGYNAVVKGTCSDGFFTVSDYCDTDYTPNLREYLCLDGRCALRNDICVSGKTCINGACVTTESSPEPTPTVPLTDAECIAWMTSLGKEGYYNDASMNSIDACGGYSWSACNNAGKTLKYFDWISNCCVWTCE